ncbi:MAG: Fibronectin, type [Acidobacteriales bacterium]|nr:Fibronectin, type [Terriglobales bacterium]
MNITLSKLATFCLVLFAAFEIGCGTPSSPQPPSLNIPKPVGDLQAVRKGDTVYLRWTVPTETTDGQGIDPNKLGNTRICRGAVSEVPNSCKDLVAEVPTKADSTGHAEASDKIAGYIGGSRDFLTYTVKVNNTRNKNAGPSNALPIFLAPSMPAPPRIDANLFPDAIRISFTAPPAPQSPNLRTNHLYRIVRTSDSADKKQPARVQVGELPATPGPESMLDKNFTWENKYSYKVIGVTQVISRDGKQLAEFEGEDSPEAVIIAHDIFPPARPSGLQAVYSALEQRKFIDLTWSPNDDSDIAGYNLYRKASDENTAPAKLNSELIKTTSYRDEKISSGKTYIYSVTAVDARGNESPMSQPAQEKVPQ